MLTKNINYIKSIKIVKMKSIDFTVFYKLYKIYKNYKKAIFHPAKVLCGYNLHLGFKSLLLRFLVPFSPVGFFKVSSVFSKCSQNAHKIFSSSSAVFALICTSLIIAEYISFVVEVRA